MSVDTTCEEDISRWFYINNIIETPAKPLDMSNADEIVQMGDLTIAVHGGGLGFRDSIVPDDVKYYRREN